MSRNIDVNVGVRCNFHWLFFFFFKKHFICCLVTFHQEADEQFNRTSGVESFGVLSVLSEGAPTIDSLLGSNVKASKRTAVVFLSFLIDFILYSLLCNVYTMYKNTNARVKSLYIYAHMSICSPDMKAQGASEHLLPVDLRCCFCK